MATTETFANFSAEFDSFRQTPEAQIIQRTGFLEYLITGIPLVTARRMLNIPIKLFLGVISLVSNIINIAIFLEIGLSDSVTITLFGVAFADVWYSYFLLTVNIFDILDASVGLFPFEPLKIVTYQAIWLYFCFSDIAMVLTVFNAVQKCACVAIPFIFKSIFTNFRAKYIVCFIYTAMFIVYLPNLLSPGTNTYYDKINNRTRLGNYFRSNNPIGQNFYEIFCKIVLSFISQVTVISCTVCLSVKLKQAIQSRYLLISNRNDSISGDQVTSSSASKMKTSTKELQAIQTVTMVSAIFVICRLPDVCISVTYVFYKDGEENLLKLCSAVKGVLDAINTTTSILVYLKFNTKYRQAFFDKFKSTRCNRKAFTTAKNRTT